MRIEDERVGDRNTAEEPAKTREPERQRPGPSEAEPTELEERLPPPPAVERDR